MAECNVSIDQENLPGVKEVCRDFAVLEDHCLAYNLQEQEIESHLASNVNKSRLVQKDLQVAKKLQEEEDERAKIQSQKDHSVIEQKDIRIAQEIQEELVRQAEHQRLQEEKDAAFARKMQEKEERKRQKQLESNTEEDYFEDHGGARRLLDLDKQGGYGTHSPSRNDSHASVNTRRDYSPEYSPEYSSTEAKRSGHPKLDSAAPRGRSKYPEHYSGSEGAHSRHADPYPEHLVPSRGKHGDRYTEYEHPESGRARGSSWEDKERAMRKWEKLERDKDRVKEEQYDQDRSKDREWDRRHVRDHNRDGDEERWTKGRNRERSRDRVLSPDKHRPRQKGEGRQHGRGHSRDRKLEQDFSEEGKGWDRARKNTNSWEEKEEDIERERRDRGRHRVHSGHEEVFDDYRSNEGTSDSREFLDAQHWEGPSRERTHSHPGRETGRIVHRGSGAVVAENDGLNEATKGILELDLQELKDMEVARKLQEEEMKTSSVHVRAAQVAQDEEIARMLMEKEKKEFKKNREREKEKERERERLAMERRRHEGNYRPHSEEAFRPRPRDEHEHHRHRQNNKPSRPPQPRPHNYENVHAGSGYSDYPGAPRASSRPDAAHRGAYYKR
ncbi:coiled-coil domain-containing protein 50 isoform X1 [Gouania willdenowi]|uniref:Coiled-coil domain-containing protein n=1 Tax=Gouania willdenowi TaxID=441366 RepID=A0A8C5I865_GOUWI|nr:coiled-coil domain-containing protein 50 isoform X1 [Gouania willdenowi]